MSPRVIFTLHLYIIINVPLEIISTTLLFCGFALYCPWRTSVAPPTRIWRPRPIRKQPKFSKAPLRGAGILLVLGAREEKACLCAKRIRRVRVRTRFQLGLAPCFDLFSLRIPG